MNFTLVADPERLITEAYGVKRNMVVTSFAKRVTFLIDIEGMIRHIWPKVDLDGHVAEVLAKIKELKLN